MNRDLLNNADPVAVRTATVSIFDRVQSQQPHVQLMSLCAAFLILAEHWRIPAQDVFTVTKNLMNDADGRHVVEFNAMRQYVKDEL